MKIQALSKGTATITVSPDGSTTTKAAQDVVDAYNALADALDTMTANAVNQTPGPLAGNPTVRDLARSMRSLITSLSVSGKFNSLGDVGVTSGAVGSKVGSTTRLQLDASKLSDAIASDSSAVATLFANVMKPIDAAVKGWVSYGGTISSAQKDITNQLTLLVKQEADVNIRVQTRQAALEAKFSRWSRCSPRCRPRRTRSPTRSPSRTRARASPRRLQANAGGASSARLVVPAASRNLDRALRARRRAPRPSAAASRYAWAHPARVRPDRRLAQDASRVPRLRGPRAGRGRRRGRADGAPSRLASARAARPRRSGWGRTDRPRRAPTPRSRPPQGCTRASAARCGRGCGHRRPGAPRRSTAGRRPAPRRRPALPRPTAAPRRRGP
ncbi:MAG: flagellar filament capping protein FliD [Chloroflexota bacterium]